MSSSQDHDRRTIEIEEDGQLLASAQVQVTDQPGVVHTDLHAAPGHLPPATRAHLVDAVLEHPDVYSAEHLVATMPTGDTEMLDRVRERCEDVEPHAAGATKIVDARLTSSTAPEADGSTSGARR